MLQNEIANEKLKGLSPEQIAEIEDNFKQFDEGSGVLSKKQLKACLYSLGEERTRSQIDEITNQRGSNVHLPPCCIVSLLTRRNRVRSLTSHSRSS